MASTEWVNKTSNDLGRVQQVFDLAIAGAAQGFTSVIKAIKVRSKSLVIGDGGSNGQYVSFSFTPSAVTGTNLDIALYGADTIDGDKSLLLADIVAVLENDGVRITGIIDVQQYPSAFYFISVTGDNAETGNTMLIAISGDMGGSQPLA
jgi:hypothetical protein